jgi:hypothetical protein
MKFRKTNVVSTEDSDVSTRDYVISTGDNVVFTDVASGTAKLVHYLAYYVPSSKSTIYIIFYIMILGQTNTYLIYLSDTLYYLNSELSG